MLTGSRAPPLRPYTGYTALCPFRDRERPVGQRSSVPKNWQTRRLDRENQNWNHRQKLSDAQKVGIKTSPHCSKTDGLKKMIKTQTGHHCRHEATDKVKVEHLLTTVESSQAEISFFVPVYLYYSIVCPFLQSWGQSQFWEWLTINAESKCPLSLSVTPSLPC